MRLEDVLARQHSVLSLTQAHDCGMSTRTVRRRVLARAWREIHPGKYLVAGYPLDNLPDGEAFVDRVLQQGRVTFAELHRAYCRAGGSRRMGRAGDLLTAVGAGAESALERRPLTGLRRAGLTDAVAGHPFGETWIDIAFPGAMVAVEIDSWAWHTDRDRFASDRAKGNALVIAGWTVLRFAWHDVTHHLSAVVARIRTAVGR